MQYILEGIIFGLGLAILLGPLFIVLVQASLEKGTRGGIIAALGIWVSDFIFAFLSLYFVKQIAPYTENEGFTFWISLCGGIILLGVGVATFFRKSTIAFDKQAIGKLGALGLFTKGFLVNTVNPFTFIFWLTTLTAFVGKRQLNSTESFLFTMSILLTIICTDSIKVFAARLIRTKINDQLLRTINKVAGGALFVFGIGLLIHCLR